jgi:hypothetical protein
MTECGADEPAALRSGREGCPYEQPTAGSRGPGVGGVPSPRPVPPPCEREPGWQIVQGGGALRGSLQPRD